MRPNLKLHQSHSGTTVDGRETRHPILALNEGKTQHLILALDEREDHNIQYWIWMGGEKKQDEQYFLWTAEKVTSSNTGFGWKKRQLN